MGRPSNSSVSMKCFAKNVALYVVESNRIMHGFVVYLFKMLNKVLEILKKKFNCTVIGICKASCGAA